MSFQTRIAWYASSENPPMSNKSPDYWELAIAVNAAFKGLLGSMGESGHVCARTRHVERHLDLDERWEVVCRRIAGILLEQLDDGDTVVVPDKIVAAAQGRIGPRSVLHDPDPKTIDPSLLVGLAEDYSRQLDFRVDPLHLLLADEYGADRATLGADNHNRCAFELAERIRDITGRNVDVVISDTDTGLDVRSPLIGCVTIGATPLGATAGLNLYAAMRCAVAAEFVRGHGRNVPLVVCVPADRCRRRTGLGQMRHYDGALHVDREPSIACA
jgi:hypothetical protein